MRQVPLCIDGHILGSTGYAQLVRGITFGLHKTGLFNIKVFPRDWVNLGDVEDFTEEESNLIQGFLKNDTVDLEKSIFLSMNVASNFQPRGKYNFGFTMLETDRVSGMWAASCNRMDAVFVPTEFNVTTFGNSGVTKPLISIPLGGDSTYFNLEFKHNSKFDFISTPFNFVFNGQWAPGDRKGVGMLLKSFLEVFKGSGRVGLIMKLFHGSSCSADFLACTSLLKQAKAQAGVGELPKVYLIHGKLSREELAQLYRMGHVLVLPSLGESWGLPLHEASLCGLSVVATRGSGPDYYLDYNLTRFLNSRVGLVPRQLQIPGLYEADMRVTLPDVEDLKDTLQDMFHRYPVWKDRALRQREKLRDLTWENSANKILEYWKSKGIVEG